MRGSVVHAAWPSFLACTEAETAARSLVAAGLGGRRLRLVAGLVFQARGDAHHPQPGRLALEAVIDRALHVEDLVAFLGLRPMRSAPSQACTQTHFISGFTSQCPLSRTPPHGPLRRFFGQFIGHDMPVEESAHCPHIWQSNRKPLVTLLDALERLLELLVADLVPQRMQRDQRLLERAIERVEALAHGAPTRGGRQYISVPRRQRANAHKNPLPQAGGGSGWGLFSRAKASSSGSAGFPLLNPPPARGRR